ncbi:MAG: hypothetical protein KJ011_00235 [Burkholderiaceae bacterium]|nr:hypothetical protein [Burkholderiaceae bacterium]
MTRTGLHSLLVLGHFLAAGGALAQTSPAFGPLPDAQSNSGATPALDSMPLADYLGLLQRIAPAAEVGARTYLAAMQLRCQRTLSSGELRLAVARGEGNAVLMGLIRAAHTKDTAARDRWIAQLPCPSEVGR